MSYVRRVAGSIVALGVVFAAGSAAAETLPGALAKAYQTNSSINSARAGVRATDEGVAIAKSGWRPTVEGTAEFDHSWQSGSRLTTGSFGVAISQVIFDGFRTRNGVHAAKAQVLAQREVLRNTVQNILFNAAAAYMDVIRDRKIAELRKQNLSFLGEQVRAARARLDVGEGTRTDVAQAEARRSAATAQLNAARAQVRSSEAVYRQLVGSEPNGLKMGKPVSRLVPKSIEGAFSVAEGEHPAIRATKHGADAAAYSVKVAEGQFLPTLSAQVGVKTSKTDAGGRNLFASGAEGQTDSANISAKLSIPIYQGGRASAEVRQKKEQYGQARIDIDGARADVRAAVSSAYAQYEAALASVSANRDLVSAARLALNGVIEERNVGQRTTLEVLNAQADVIDARISQASAERDVVVASYAIVSAIGRLEPGRLGLGVREYKPEEHFEAVEDKWYGLRTPEGR